MGVLLPHTCPARADAPCGRELCLVSVSDVMSSFSFVLLPAFIRTRPSLKPAQVPLGPLMRAELCVGCCGLCQSPAPQGVVPAVRDG